MPQAVATTGYRGPNVCKIVGISYRQLDYWARTGLATPSVQPAMGSGSQRLYSFEDLIELKLIKKLLDTGVSLQRVREAIDYLRTLGSDLSGVTLVSDGASIFACHSDHEVVDVLRPAESEEPVVPEGDAGEVPPRLKVAPSGGASGAPQGAG
jgi:DNA-binding transcriptional MerR regulator